MFRRFPSDLSVIGSFAFCCCPHYRVLSPHLVCFPHSSRGGNEELAIVGGKLQLIMFFLSVSGWCLELLWFDPSCRFESLLQVGCESRDGPGKEAEDKKNLSHLCQSEVLVPPPSLHPLFHSASI